VAVEKLNLNGLIGQEIRQEFANLICTQGYLFIVLGIHEDIGGSIAIEIDHVPAFERSLLKPVFRTKLFFRADSRAQILKFGLHKSTLVPGGEVPYRRNSIEVSFVNDNHAYPKLS
jgi:hypothetical protein